MTLELPGRTESRSDDSLDPRRQLANLFRRPPPAVTVIVKKRRHIAGEIVGHVAGNTAEETLSVRTDSADQGPRSSVQPNHRRQDATVGNAASLSRVHRAPMAPANDRGAGASTAGGHVEPAVPQAVVAQRRRRGRDPLRQPGEVRILVQSPTPPADSPEDVPAWQRLLRLPEQDVSYLQVVQALRQLQQTVQEAQRAAASCDF
jgi:hypothetical protein